jgi:peptidoglycan/xylan/chitin deacetylase (PgdA/CDA1 family)
MNSGKSVILTYHSIDESGSVISTSARDFERQLESIAASGLKVGPLSSVIDRPGTVAITFDDGFRNFRTVAAPLLERYHFPATVFVVSGFCGQDNQWPGQSARVPVLSLMDWSELEEIAGRGFAIGAHTIHHPDLSKLSDEKAAHEMAGSKEQIEQRLGRRVHEFAYPYGRIPLKVRPEFAFACSTRLSYTRPGNDPLELPRIDACYLRAFPDAGSVLSRRAAWYFGARGIVRNLRQWLSRSS